MTCSVILSGAKDLYFCQPAWLWLAGEIQVLRLRLCCAKTPLRMTRV